MLLPCTWIHARVSNDTQLDAEPELRPRGGAEGGGLDGNHEEDGLVEPGLLLIPVYHI